jgi:20S proteasome subunit beta 2
MKFPHFRLFKFFVLSVAGCGIAADMFQTCKYIEINMRNQCFNTNRKIVPVIAAVKFASHYFFDFNGEFINDLIIGGVDHEGPHIYSIHHHGSIARLPYATMGSGTLPSMAVFEARWKPDMTLEEGKKLVSDAVTSGICNDLGSGSNVDICIIRKNSYEMIRGYDIVGQKGERCQSYTPKRGTSAFYSKETRKIDIEVIEKHEKMIE